MDPGEGVESNCVSAVWAEVLVEVGAMRSCCPAERAAAAPPVAGLERTDFWFPLSTLSKEVDLAEEACCCSEGLLFYRWLYMRQRSGLRPFQLLIVSDLGRVLRCPRRDHHYRRSSVDYRWLHKVMVEVSMFVSNRDLSCSIGQRTIFGGLKSLQDLRPLGSQG